MNRILAWAARAALLASVALTVGCSSSGGGGGGSSNNNDDDSDSPISDLYFVAYEEGSGYQLWKTDGSSSGTSRVTAIGPSGPGGMEGDAEITAVGDLVFFVGDQDYEDVGDELWVTDGTSSGTELLASDIYPYALTAVDDVVAFTAEEGSDGFDPWTSDGTPSGTALLVNLNGDGDSGTDWYAGLDGNILFDADADVAGEEVWVWDGSDATRISQIGPTTFGALPAWLTTFGGKVYFSAINNLNSGGSNYELWESNGSSVILTEDINPYSEGAAVGSYPNHLVVLDDVLYFFADDTVDGDLSPVPKLWRYNGSGSPEKVTDLGVNGSQSPDSVVVADGAIYFFLDDENGDEQLWKSDGTADGTFPLSEVIGLNVPVEGCNPRILGGSDGKIVFMLDNDGDPDGHDELWVTDGTEAGTTMLMDTLNCTAF